MLTYFTRFIGWLLLVIILRHYFDDIILCFTAFRSIIQYRQAYSPLPNRFLLLANIADSPIRRHYADKTTGFGIRSVFLILFRFVVLFQARSAITRQDVCRRAMPRARWPPASISVRPDYRRSLRRHFTLAISSRRFSRLSRRSVTMSFNERPAKMLIFTF